jgi:hypothetical protein
MLLDQVLSVITYFDFVSYDTFIMIERAKYWAKAAKRPSITGEFLLMPFLDPEFEFSIILKEYGFEEEEIWKLIKLSNKIPKLSFWQHKSFYLHKLFEGRFPFFSKSLVSKKINYSYDTRVLFEKAAENALTRFKTPVISPEILFITMMEQRTDKVGRMIKRYFPEETSWYLFRYRLIKRIHFQEVAIRTQVPKSAQYFAYLLKIHLPEYEFNKMVDMELLPLGVSTFRNKIITRLLTMDLFDILEGDIGQSIRHMRKKRKYLTRRGPRKSSKGGRKYSKGTRKYST